MRLVVKMPAVVLKIALLATVLHLDIQELVCFVFVLYVDLSIPVRVTG